MSNPVPGWDFDITSNADEKDASKADAKVNQRFRLCRAVRHILEEATILMDDGHGQYGGWPVVDDEFLDELQAPTKRFWRLEIVSRPIRADEPWKDEMELVYQSLALWFHIYGGASSHDQAIKQVIFTLSNHVSMLATDWVAKRETTAKPTAQQFITELVGSP
ncbi:hypothetical protein B0T24DRAFT_598741 [Lasiosphaeria ovina]|uniref:Uncharacterized protein n=1 Tax=Lasiosphaeria ovina TaxID=92902 RepID=A0AAE0JUS1_9PEZI|nr:hypothetical protein B0T24DRAFT_598741 [Lasiosphaeria ovina]